MAGTGLFVLVVLIGLVAPLVLHWLVRAEHENRQVMDRADAERVARRDVDDGDRDGRR